VIAREYLGDAGLPPRQPLRRTEGSVVNQEYVPAASVARQVILGVAASDAHAVANQLIAMTLRQRGFIVINLGVCTPLAEFAAAYLANPSAEAVIVASLNGHAYEDLRGLNELKRTGQIGCPVIVGGNLSVGSHKSDSHIARLFDIGVDYVLSDPNELPGLLDRIAAERAGADSAVAHSLAAHRSRELSHA
jgi:methylaspartate mutase sigma subunit